MENNEKTSLLEKLNTRNKFNKWKILIGFLFIASVIYSYYDYTEWMFIEGTGISNLLAGIILIIDGILLYKNKRVPIVIYQMEVGLIMTVYCVTTFLTAFNIVNFFNFQGGAMFLHSINPLVFLMIYLLTTRIKENCIIKYSILAPIPFMIYLLFDFIWRQINGYYLYGLIPDNTSIILIMLIGVLAYIVELLFNYGLIKLNLYIKTKIKD